MSDVETNQEVQETAQPAANAEPQQPKTYGLWQTEPSAEDAQKAEQAAAEAKKAEFEKSQAAQRELEAARKALKDQQDRVKAAERGLSDYQEAAKKDPKSFLSSLGYDPLDLAQRLVSSDGEDEAPETNEVSALMQRVQQLEQQIQAREIKEVEARQIGEITTLLSSEKTPWLLALRDDGGEPVEQQLLRAAVIRYQQTGEVPDYQAMIDEAESKMREKYQKIISRFTPQAASERKPAKTLTNGLNDEAAPLNIADMEELDRQERFKRIMRESGWK